MTCDNVGSRQMQQIRIALRGTATVVMGKNVSSRCLPFTLYSLTAYP